MLERDHPNQVNSYMNFGVSVARYDTARATRLHQRAFGIRQGSTRFAKIQVQVQGLALYHLNIGRSWLEVGEFDKAIEAFENCIALIEPKEEETGLRYAL